MMENSEPRSNVMKIGAIINGGPHENGVNTQGTDSVFYTFRYVLRFLRSVITNDNKVKMS